MTPTPLYVASMKALECQKQIDMLRDTLDKLHIDLSLMEDTWAECTPIPNTFMTSIDVVEYVLKDRKKLAIEIQQDMTRLYEESRQGQELARKWVEEHK